MDTTVAIVTVANGIDTVEIPSSYPAISKLLGVTIIQMTTDGSTITLSQSIDNSTLKSDREIQLEATPTANSIAVVMYEPLITFNRIAFTPPAEM